MKALHLCPDHNFIEHSREIFEKYYPDRNIFIITSKFPDYKIIKNKQGFIKMDISLPDSFQILGKICKENNVDKIVLHGISMSMFPGIAKLKTELKCQVYWIVWGFEMYQLLGYECNYKLIDSNPSILKKESYYVPNALSKVVRRITKNYLPNVVRRLIPYIDYFCFWNYGDYELLKKNVPNKLQYKYFAYSANTKNQEPAYLFPLTNKTYKSILINHQASLYGNHNTVLKKIAEIDKNNEYTKITPLSYGNSVIKKNVLKLGKRLFADKYKPILDYMDKEIYYSTIKDVDVAIFGPRRQEASGNIIHLLKNGVKVFLREDNNLFDYYKQQGYLIFSFEKDLTSYEDLKPLTLPEKEYNRQIYLHNLKYYDDFMIDFFN